MCYYFKLLLVSLLLHISYTYEIRSYKNYKIFELVGDKKDVDNVIDVMKELDKSLNYESRKNGTGILVAPEHLSAFEKIIANKQLQAKLLTNDFSELIHLEKISALRSKEFSWTAYYDVDEIYDYLKNTSQTYKNWTQLIVGGESHEGRQILGLRINTPEENGNCKPVIFIESGIHAREWITPATTTYFINQLLSSDDPDISALRDQFDWRIFPTVNPDGYHYSYNVDRMWRKTRSKSSNGCYGADPNRNWDYNWGKHGSSNNPCDNQIYAGAYPFSETETRTLSSYVAGIENLLAYIAFHSDAQCLLLPYSDSAEHVDNYDDLYRIGKTSLNYGYKVNGERYNGPGTAAEILYKVSGGSMDWVRHALGTRLVYTYELRGYYFHWPPSQIYQQGNEVTQMLLGLSTEARNLGYY